MIERIRILGVPVDSLTPEKARSEVERSLLGERRGGAVLAVNPEKVIRAQVDPELLRCLEGAALLIPDGIGVVVAARILSLGKMKRVPGSELMPSICEIAMHMEKSVFLFGASPDVNQRARVELARQFPKLRIAGSRHGYPGAEGRDGITEAIQRANPDVVFVALGSPAQEHWIAEQMRRCPNVKIWQGVGGTFDVIAGEVKRAPRAWRQLNLEWLYRLLSNPRRASRQLSLARFTALVLRARLFGG